MTKQELNIILKLIDNNTQEKENGYCGMYGYSKYMGENNIRKLKQDIKDVFLAEDNK